MSKVMEVLLRHRKITQEQYDKAVVREEKKKAAKERYKAGKSKLNKGELQEILDVLTE